MIDELIVNIAKILAVLGVFFIFFKQFRNRTTNESYHKFYKKYRKLFYHLHVTGIKLATLLGFVHGITIKPIDQTYIISGWLLGIVMVILLVIGVIMSIKTNSTPMTPEEDVKMRKPRIIKWVLTVVVFLFLVLHYFPPI